MRTQSRAIIVAARRSAIGRVGGLHRNRIIEQLAAPVIQTALADAGIAPREVEALLLGNAAGGGGNPARLVLLQAGLPHSLPGYTVDSQCASGLDAICFAARLIETGGAEIVIAGGAESPSTAPWRVTKPGNLYRGIPQFYQEARFAPDAQGNPSMIEAAEAVAREYAISRERQDAFAVESHHKASTPAARQFAQGEIVPLEGAKSDESVRPALKPALLARMPTLLPDGTVTAGNSCPISDGAAFAILVSERVFRERRYQAGLWLRDSASAGGDPRLLGVAAVPAVERLFSRQPGARADISTIAFVEAFAAQVLATLGLLNLDPARVNPYGGALALGHPYGASGALLAVQLFSQLVRNRDARTGLTGLAMAAAAGGVGTAALFEVLD